MRTKKKDARRLLSAHPLLILKKLHRRPVGNVRDYVYQGFRLAQNLKIVVYSWHVEQRKGVSVPIESPCVACHSERTDVCFVLCGNRKGESPHYEHLGQMCAGLGAEDLIRFLGVPLRLASNVRAAFVE